VRSKVRRRRITHRLTVMKVNGSGMHLNRFTAHSSSCSYLGSRFHRLTAPTMCQYNYRNIANTRQNFPYFTNVHSFDLKKIIVVKTLISLPANFHSDISGINVLLCGHARLQKSFYREKCNRSKFPLQEKEFE